jgi:hypothetical protein
MGDYEVEDVEDTEDYGALIDINISFTPIPKNDFDDLEEGMEDEGKILDAWVWDVYGIIEKIHPDFESMQVYVTELDRDYNTCTIQFVTNENLLSETVSDDSFEDKVKEFLETKYPESKVRVSLSNPYTT